MSNGTTYFDYAEAKEYANTMKGFGYQVHLGKGKVVGSWVVKVGEQTNKASKGKQPKAYEKPLKSTLQEEFTHMEHPTGKKIGKALAIGAVKELKAAPKYVFKETVSAPMRTMAAGPKHHPHPWLRKPSDYNMARGKHPRIALDIPFNYTPKPMPDSIGQRVRYKNIGRIQTTERDISDVNLRSRDITQ